MFHPPCLSVPRVCFLSIDPAPTEIYTLSLHDALPISTLPGTSFPSALSTGLGNPAAPPRGVTGLGAAQDQADFTSQCGDRKSTRLNSSHITISYAVFCLKKKNNETKRNGDCRTKRLHL